MKKVVLGIFVIASLVACNKGKSVDKLENDDQKASYAFGTGLGDQIKSLRGRLADTDSINYDQLEKGIRDYLKADKEGRESFAIGQQVGQQVETVIKQQQLDQMDRDIIVQGIMDVVRHKKLLITQEAGMGILDNYAKKHQEEMIKKNSEESKKLIDEKKKTSGAKFTDSGLVYVIEKEGDGNKPKANSTVKVKYTGKLLSNGKVFDSSDKSPDGKDGIEFPLNQVIPGWSEGLQLMSKGAKYKLYIPANLAYGESGVPGAQIGPNQALEFDVELIDFKDTPAESKQEGGGKQQSSLSDDQIKELQKQLQNQSNQAK